MELEIWRDIFAERADQERWLTKKHPWYPILMNWIGAILLTILLIASVVMAIKANTQKKAEEMTATAMAAWEASQEATQEEIRSAQENILEQEATAMAKAFYGIRLFVEKYGYSREDFETYARCMFNRADAGSGRLTEVIAQEGQFIAYSDQNTVLDEYYEMALEFVRQWHEEETKPCDLSYQFAELTPQGIFLKNDIHADGYSRRWRA